MHIHLKKKKSFIQLRVIQLFPFGWTLPASYFQHLHIQIILDYNGSSHRSRSLCVIILNDQELYI